MLSLHSASLAFATAPLRVNAPSAVASVRMGISELEGTGPLFPEAGAFYDPLGIAETSSDKTLAWFRHAELKHGRVAMAAFASVVYFGMGGQTFSGAIALDGTKFSDLGTDPWLAWGNLPFLGKLQIILVLGAFEFLSEYQKPHYMSGGTPGKIMLGEGLPLFDPLGWLKGQSAEKRAYKRASELKNGRLAMIGIASYYFAHTIPGSVPGFPSSLAGF